jgi:HSP20 family protein
LNPDGTAWDDMKGTVMEGKRIPTSEIIDRIQGEVKRWVKGFSEVDLLAFARGEWVPPIDLHATEGGAELLVDLPGLGSDAISLVLRGEQLILTGDRPSLEPAVRPLAAERKTGPFRRTVTLPFRPDPSAVEAKLTDGVLRVTLKQMDAAQTDEVAIEVK